MRSCKVSRIETSSVHYTLEYLVDSDLNDEFFLSVNEFALSAIDFFTVS